MAAQDAGGIELGTYGTVERGGEEGDSLEEAFGSLGDSVSLTPPSSTPSSSAMSAAELPRKRKGEAESFLHQGLDYDMEDDFSRSEESDDQQVKMKCFRQPHRHIEKRRRDKMNVLIDELSAVLPACNPASRKLDKLTVLRTAVQHLKALKAGTARAFTDSTSKPAFLPEDDLQHMVLRAADGFLLVVSCDRGKILFISESVSEILNVSRVCSLTQPQSPIRLRQLELAGQSLFHFLHPKDIAKVKEQLSASEFPRKRLVDATTGVEIQDDPPLSGPYLSTGARRSFFCRMKHCRGSGNMADKTTLPGSSRKKDSSRYTTVHCTGYMRSWPRAQRDVESDAEKDDAQLTCLVTVCRVHPHGAPPPPREVQVKPAEFVTRCAIDGKFTFVDQEATVITGYLPQEVLGTSCYEYFHQEDLQHLAEKHRQVLRSKEKIETNCYKFKTKHGPYVSLQSQWFSFTNPWTKEVEFIVSSNRVISGLNHSKEEDEADSSKALQEDSKRNLPIIPGLSIGRGKMIYAGSIGTQIANELIDAYRISSTPSSGAASPFGPGPVRSPVVPPDSSRSTSSRPETPGRSEDQSGLRTAALSDIKTSGETETALLDLDPLVTPGLSSFSSDEAAMAVIMSLMESDTSIGQGVNYEDIHWPV